jgi:hypothetical protein
MLFAVDPLNILIAYPTTRRGVVSFVDSPNRCHVRRRQRLKLRKGDETDAPPLPLLPPLAFHCGGHCCILDMRAVLSITTRRISRRVVSRKRKLGGPMPIYQFVVRSGDHEDDPDVRWSHLSDEDAARRYGHLLIKDFKSSGRYPDSSHLYVVVKDEMGTPLISIPFRDIV